MNSVVSTLFFYEYKKIPGFEDDINFPSFLIWEIIWLVLNNRFSSGDKILDLGGFIFSIFVLPCV